MILLGWHGSVRVRDPEVFDDWLTEIKEGLIDHLLTAVELQLLKDIEHLQKLHTS